MMSDAERLAGVATESVEQIKAWVEGTASPFMADQAPLYVQEVVAWEIWSHAALTALGFGLLVVAGLAFVMLVRVGSKIPEGKASYDVEQTFTWWFFSSATLGLIGCTVFAVNAYCMLRPIVAPRVVILEHLRGLV